MKLPKVLNEFFRMCARTFADERGILDIGDNSSTTNYNETWVTDQSKAMDAAFSGTVGSGSLMMSGDYSGATLNMIDPGAIMAAQSVAQDAIKSASDTAARVAGAANLAIDRAFSLGGQASQTDTQAVLGSLTKIMAVVAVLGVAGALVWYFARKGNK